MQVSKMKKEDFFVWFLLKIFYLDMLLYKKLENTISFIAWHTVIDILLLAMIFIDRVPKNCILSFSLLPFFVKLLHLSSFHPLQVYFSSLCFPLSYFDNNPN